MWYLLEDLLEQPLIMKVFVAWGWLAIWIMVFSAASSVMDITRSMTADSQPSTEQVPTERVQAKQAH